MADAARLAIVYFAWVRDMIGADSETIDHPGADVTVADIIGALARKSAGHAAAFADHNRLRAALDQQFVSLDTPLGTARELAIFPPVTGG